MYSIRHLLNIGYDGLADLVPAIRQAFNADPTDDHLNEVYGSSPRAMIVGLSVLGIVAGELLNRNSDLPASQYIHWPAVVVGLIFALLLRRYLFSSGRARDGVHEQDFPWLAASLVVPLGLLVVESVLMDLITPTEAAEAGTDAPLSFIGDVLVIATHALGVAAAMTIAVAALCFSRNWIQGLFDLAIRLLVFRIMVFVTTLILLEIGFVGPIVAALLRGIFGFQLPAWITELADQLSYAGLMCVIYLAVIGATWTVCRRSFGELLRSGHVDILKTIEDLASDPKRKQKRLEKKQKKADRKARKEAAKR